MCVCLCVHSRYLQRIIFEYHSKVKNSCLWLLKGHIWVLYATCVCVFDVFFELQCFVLSPCGSQTAAWLEIALITACEPPSQSVPLRRRMSADLMAYCSFMSWHVVYVCVCVYACVYILYVHWFSNTRIFVFFPTSLNSLKPLVGAIRR